MHVCFISRGRRGGNGKLGDDYGIMPDGFTGPKIRVVCEDDSPTATIFGGELAPAEYLAAINEFERKRHAAMGWPDWLGQKPDFVVPFPSAGFVPCYSVSPYGTFI
jgi:hypothetical protein